MEDIASSRYRVVGFLGGVVFLLYVLTMPLPFPPDADAIRWAQWVESPTPVWESRHLLAWPMERAHLQLWRTLGCGGKAFLPMQVLHAALAALTLAGIVWLLMRRGVRADRAVALGLVIGLSYTWLQYARSAHVRMPSVAFGVLAIVLALGVSDERLRRPWTLAGIVAGGALAALLQINGVAFVLVAATITALRARSQGRAWLARGVGTLLAPLALTVLGYSAVWHWGGVREQYASATIWIAAHPEQGTLDAGASGMQVLRAGAGLIRALGGETRAISAIKTMLTGASGTQSGLGAGDWLALGGGLTALVLGCLATVRCLGGPATRWDGMAVAFVVAIGVGFGVFWTGSDAWLWLAPAAFLWYAVGLWVSGTSRRRTMFDGLLVAAMLLSTAGAYRAIEAPCLLTSRASPDVRNAIAYARQTTPTDVAVGFWGWTNWLDYGLDRQDLYLYHASFGGPWRQRLIDGLRRVPPSSRVFVTADVVEPTDIDTLEMWDRVEKANGMARAEVVRVLKQEGELVRRDGMLPDEPIWELVRGQ